MFWNTDLLHSELNEVTRGRQVSGSVITSDAEVVFLLLFLYLQDYATTEQISLKLGGI